MVTYKNRLPASLLVGYISGAPHKTGAGTATPLTIRAHSRASGFTCKASSRLFLRIMAGRTGEPQGSPGSLVAGRCSPVRLATQSLQPLVGELSQFTTRGSTSWQTADTPALTFSALTPRQKSTAVCTAQKNWRAAYGLSPSAITALLWTCVFHRFSATWLTISATYTSCLTKKKTLNNTPEKLTRKQHSAGWWSVCLPDIQEALCLHR